MAARIQRAQQFHVARDRVKRKRLLAHFASGKQPLLAAPVRCLYAVQYASAKQITRYVYRTYAALGRMHLNSSQVKPKSIILCGRLTLFDRLGG